MPSKNNHSPPTPAGSSAGSSDSQNTANKDPLAEMMASQTEQQQELYEQLREQSDRLAQYIKENGFSNPAFLMDDGQIVGGQPDMDYDNPDIDMDYDDHDDLVVDHNWAEVTDESKTSTPSATPLSEKQKEMHAWIIAQVRKEQERQALQEWANCYGAVRIAKEDILDSPSVVKRNW